MALIKIPNFKKRSCEDFYLALKEIDLFKKHQIRLDYYFTPKNKKKILNMMFKVANIILMQGQEACSTLTMRRYGDKRHDT